MEVVPIAPEFVSEPRNHYQRALAAGKRQHIVAARERPEGTGNRWLMPNFCEVIGDRCRVGKAKAGM